jgi:hypothetical protein
VEEEDEVPQKEEKASRTAGEPDVDVNRAAREKRVK